MFRYIFLKRIFDILFASLALIILSPLFLIILLFLVVSSPGEIFFLQTRIGYHHKPFRIIKFSSMQKGSANQGLGTITLRNDTRVTKFGKFLRITKLNELPQIINVLIGNMSLVGPRPLLFKDLGTFPASLKEAIYNSKPGITGIGPIVFRDEEILVTHAKDPVSFHINEIQPYKGELELWYLQNKSLSLDLTVIFMTFWIIIFPKSTLPFKVFRNLPAKPIALMV